MVTNKITMNVMLNFAIITTTSVVYAVVHEAALHSTQAHTEIPELSQTFSHTV